MSVLPPVPQPTNQRIAVDVVVHTHWDREWYMDRETTLARLEEVMQRVVADLDADRLQQFLFDGQTVALEDLVSRAPSGLIQRLRQHAQAGRLVLGPWYVASDEFLVSGESLLRNLALGIAQARAWGGAQAVGYLPDTFGHAAQMPQILRQFGIAHAVVWRGVESPYDLLDWHAPDGSSVTTVYLTEGYYLHPLHGPSWLHETQLLLSKLHARRDPALAGPLLLTHGGDHLAPHPELAVRIQDFNRKQDQFDLQQGTLLKHIQTLEARKAKRPTLSGELRHNRSAFVLPDVLSTRRYLKRLHQAAEDRLVGHIEPLMAQTGARATEHAWLQSAWRLLLQQQAHDSICGCSRDEVHQDMVQRFAQLHRCLDALEQRLLYRAGLVEWDRYTADRDASVRATVDEPAEHQVPNGGVFADDTRFTVFNPLPWQRHAWFEVSLFLRGPSRTGLGVTGPEGETIPTVVLNIEPAFELVSPLDEFPERLDGHRYTLALKLSIGGLANAPLQIMQIATSPGSAPARLPAPAAQLDNGAWRVELSAQGQLLLTDRRQTPTVARPLGLMLEPDAGDTYNHSPVLGAQALLSPGWRLLEQRHDGPLQELRLGMALQVPQGLDEQRLAPTLTTVICNGELRLRLLGDEPLLHLYLSWDNQARDQRTRLVLGGVASDTGTTWRDTAFAWTAHPVVLSSVPHDIGRGEVTVCVQPSLSAFAAGPWWVAHRALHEHEIIVDPWAVSRGDHEPGLALALTLVRSVGWMSRRDLRTRGVGAGPDLPTPQAQCLGEDQFELVLVSPERDAPTHVLLQRAQDFRWPVRRLRGHAQRWAASLNLPRTALQLSACRPLEDGRLELRLWNPSDALITLDVPPGIWTRVRADGQAWNGDQRAVQPHQLITLHSMATWSLE